MSESIMSTIRKVRDFGGEVTKISTTPAIRNAIMQAEGANPDGEIRFMGIPLVADAEHPPHTISLVWWEA